MLNKELEFLDGTLGLDFTEENYETLEQQTVAAGSTVGNTITVTGNSQSITINSAPAGGGKWNLIVDGNDCKITAKPNMFDVITINGYHCSFVVGAKNFNPNKLVINCHGEDAWILSFDKNEDLSNMTIEINGTFPAFETVTEPIIKNGSHIDFNNTTVTVNGCSGLIVTNPSGGDAKSGALIVLSYYTNESRLNFFNSGVISQDDNYTNDGPKEEVIINGGTLTIEEGSTIGNVDVITGGTATVSGGTVTGGTTGSEIVNNQEDDDHNHIDDIHVKNLNIFRDDTVAGMTWDTPSVTLTNDCDLSNTNITVVWIPKDNVPVILINTSNPSDDITFAKDGAGNITQTITVNGETVGIGFDYQPNPASPTIDHKYVIYYDDETNQLMLQKVNTLRELVEDTGKNPDSTKLVVESIDFNNFYTVVDNTKQVKHSFNSKSDDLAGGAISNKVLTAASNKNLKGLGIGVSGGTIGTYVAATMYAAGNDVVMSEINWDGYAFGGNNKQLVKVAKEAAKAEAKAAKTNNGNHFAFGKNSKIKYAFGGGNLSGTTDGFYSDVNGDVITSLTVGSDVEGSSSQLLCGGSYVSGSTTNVHGTESLTIEEGAGITVGNSTDAGYVVGGSYLNSGNYTFEGSTTVDIASGEIEFLFGAGFVKSSNSVYTHNGDINMYVSGGTITETIFGGIACLADLQNVGKVIDGDINITFDSTYNEIGLKKVYGGCNGSAEITGDITVTFTGKGENLNFTNGSSVIGGNASNVKETEERILVFDNFQGDFNVGSIKKFDTIIFKNSADVNFTNSYDLKSIKTWNFGLGTCLNWDDVGNNDFSGDTLNLGTANDSLTAQNQNEWEFFTAEKLAAFSGFEEDGIQVNIFGNAAQFARFDDGSNAWVTDAGYQLAIRDNQDQTWSMVVSHC